MYIQPLDLIGLFLPPAIDIINQKVVDSRLRYLVALCLCVIIGILLNLGTIHDWQSLVANIGIVFLSAQTVHKLYWSNTSMSARLDPIISPAAKVAQP